MDVRLKPQAQLRGISADKGFGLERSFGSTIEDLDFGPLQTNHVERQLMTAGGRFGILAQPGFQARTEIAHGEGTRGALREIRLGKGIEAAVAQDGTKARKIFGKAVENPKPVLAIVNFQPFERSETVIRLDDLTRDLGHWPAVRRKAAHALRAREGSHHRASHPALGSEKLHTAAAREALARNLLALSASLCTSSKDGM